jgi:hypothetical protein
MPPTRTLLRILAAALLVYAVWSLVTTVYHWFRPDPSPIVTTVTPTVKTIEVPVEKIVTNTVTKYVRVEDRDMVNTLLAENTQLRTTVTRLTVSLAEHTSTGTVTTPPVVAPNPTPETPPSPVQYRDWRLNLTVVDAQSINYTLTQKFALAVTSGVSEKNVPVSLAALYEIGPGETRTPIPITETTYLVANKPNARWYRDLTIQGGVLSQNNRLVGVVAVPWLKRGRTMASADTRWAILTPAVTLNKSTRTIGMFPVSVNLGTVPRLRKVITNVWVSPYLGTNNLREITNQGVAVSVTF